MSDTQPQVPTPVDVAQAVSAWKYDPNYHKTCDFLGLDIYDRTNFKYAQKVSLLYDWAEVTSKSKNILDNVAKIKGLQRDLGLNLAGKELIDRLWEYVRLDMDRQRIEKTQESLRPKPPEEKKELSKDDIKKIIKKETESLKTTLAEEIKKAIPKPEVKPEIIPEVQGESNVQPT